MIFIISFSLKVSSSPLSPEKVTNVESYISGIEQYQTIHTYNGDTEAKVTTSNGDNEFSSLDSKAIPTNGFVSAKHDDEDLSSDNSSAREPSFHKRSQFSESSDDKSLENLSNSHHNTSGLLETTSGHIIVTYSILASAFKSIPKNYVLPSFESSLPPRFLAFPTFVVSSTQLSIFPLSQESKLAVDKLLAYQDQVAISTVTNPPDTIHSNKIYGYFCNGIFSRVETSHLSKLMATAYDTGECIHTLNTENLFILPEDILTIPPLRYRTAMFELECLNPKVGKAHLKELIWGQLLMVHKVNVLTNQQGLHVVLANFYSPDETMHYNDVVMKNGYSMKKSKIKSLPSPSTTNSSSLSASIDTPDLNELAKQWGMSLPELRIFQHAHKVPKWRPTSGEKTLTIFPTSIISPDCIWAQVFHNDTHNLKKLMEDMNAIYLNTTNASYVPSKGEVCAAKFSQDNLFYRAEILRVHSSGFIDVHFIDYGNKECILYKELRHIRTAFLSLPRQAVFFSLANVFPLVASLGWSHEATALLNELMLEKKTTVDVLSEEASKLFVNAYSSSNPTVLFNDLLVQKGLAKAEIDTPTKTMRGLNVSKGPVKIGRGSAFNCQLSSNQPSNSPGHMTQTDQPFEQKWREWSPHDKRQTNKPFAKKRTVQHFNQKNSDGQSQPFQKQSPKPFNQHKWTPCNTSDNECSWFSNAESTSTVKTMQPNPDSMTDSKALPVRTKVRSPTINHIDASVQALPDGRPSNSLTMPEKEVASVVLHINNPSSFYLTQVNENSIKELQRISLDMQTRVPTPLEKIVNGAYCIAKYSGDGCYGRAQIVKVLPSKKAVAVRFLDYGNTDDISTNEIGELDPIHSHLPYQAIHCSLHGVVAMSDSWTKGAIDYFNSIALNKLFMAKKIAEIDGIYSVKLTSDSIDVAQTLVTKGFAFYSNAANEVPPPLQNTTSFFECSTSPNVTAPLFNSLDVVTLPSDVTQVILTQVISPDEIYLHVASEEHIAELEKLLTYVNDDDTCAASLSLPVNSVCYAMFSEDSKWYRGKIVESSRDSYFVHFFDFGNYETVSKSNVKLCPNEILHLAVQAVQCSLNGIIPSRGSPTWDPACVEFINVNCTGKVLLCKSVGSNFVELYDTSSNEDNIAEVLIRCGYASRVERCNTSFANTGFSNTQNFAVPSPSLSELFAEQVFMEVVVSDIESVSYFWVQNVTSDNIKALSTLESNLQSYAKSQPGSFVPSQGDYCCAFFPEDNKWYRAKVLEININKAVVMYIDYGNMASVNLHHILPITKELAALPPFAYCVSLTSECPSSLQALTSLKQITTNKILFMKVIDQSVDPPQVELYDTSSGEDVNIEKYLIDAVTEVPSPIAFCSDTISSTTSSSLVTTLSSDAHEPSIIVMENQLSSVVLPSVDEFQVLIVHIESIYEIYVQLISDNLLLLLELAEKLKQYCSSAPGLSSPPIPSQICLAKCEGEYYRAQVISTDASSCLVYFIDYGNTEIVKYTDIKQISSDIASVPKQAIKCALVGIVRGNSLVTEKVKMEFVNTDAVICRVYSKSPFIVDFYSSKTSNISLREHLVQQKVLPPLQQTAYLMPQVDLAAIGTTTVIATDIKNPTYFWLQVVIDQKSRAEFEKVTHQLQEYCDAAFPLREKPLLGQLIAARFIKDNMWYRARVIDIRQSLPVVRFVDYGNTQSTTNANMCAIADDLIAYPARSVLCSLHGYVQPASQSIEKTVEMFRELIDKKPLRCVYKKAVDLDKSSVELCTLEGTDICQYMKENWK